MSTPTRRDATPAGGDGVTLSAFCDLMGGARRRQSASDELRELFRVFDRDDDGFIGSVSRRVQRCFAWASAPGSGCAQRENSCSHNE